MTALLLEVAGFVKMALERGFIAPSLVREANELLEKIGKIAASPTPEAEPFSGVEEYYRRLFQQIKGRRDENPPLGTGGDLDCLIAMVEWLWTKYRADLADAEV